MFVPKLKIRAWSVWFLHAFVTLRIGNSSLIFMVILCLSQNWNFESDLCGFGMHMLLSELKIRAWFLWLFMFVPKLIIRAWSVWFLHAYVTPRIDDSSLIFMVILCLSPIENSSLISVVSACICYSQNCKFEPDFYGYLMFVPKLNFRVWSVWFRHAFVTLRIENSSLIFILIILCLSQNWKFESDLYGFCMHMLLSELKIRAWFLWLSYVCPKIETSSLICVVSACICYSLNWKFEPDFYGYLMFAPKLKIRVWSLVSACICYSQNWKFEPDFYGSLMFVPKLKIRAWSAWFLHAYVTPRIENSSLILRLFIFSAHVYPRIENSCLICVVDYLHAGVSHRVEKSSLTSVIESLQCSCLFQNWKVEPDPCSWLSSVHVFVPKLKFRTRSLWLIIRSTNIRLEFSR